MDPSDFLGSLPESVARAALYPWLNAADWRSLRLVSKGLAAAHKKACGALNVAPCRDALAALARCTSEASDSGSSATMPCVANGIPALYPELRRVGLCCPPAMHASADVAQLLPLLGRYPQQQCLTLAAVERHPCFGGAASSAAAAAARSAARDAAGAPWPAADCEAHCARALAAALPSLRCLRFTARADCSCWCGCCNGGQAQPDSDGSSRSSGSSSGFGPQQRPRCTAGRLAPQRLLEALAVALSTPQPAAAPSGVHQGGNSTTRTTHTLSGGRNHPGTTADAVGSRGLNALCVDYAARSADAFEAEILDLDLDPDPKQDAPTLRPPPLPLLQFDPLCTGSGDARDGSGSSSSSAGGAGGSNESASRNGLGAMAAANLLARLQLPSAAPGPHPLQRLTRLELRGVRVQPRLLRDLDELCHLEHLVLSVSCPHPYRPLCGSLPRLRCLKHLHVFLHAPEPAALRQAGRPGGAAGAAAPGGPAAAPGGAGARGLAPAGVGTTAPGGTPRSTHQQGRAAAPASVWPAADAGAVGGADPEEEEEVSELGGSATPDLPSHHLVAALMLCSALTSLGLPTAEEDGRMPALLQALPSLAHLTARQLSPWLLPRPHTRLTSLTLTMAWPAHLAQLLPLLPSLRVLRTELYLHADSGGGDGSGGGGGSRGGGGGRRRGGSSSSRATGGARGGRERSGREDRRKGRDRRRDAGVGSSGEDSDDGQASARQLYEQLSAVAAALRSVPHVELQLSLLRPETWDWAVVLREVAAVRGLCALSLRLPAADSSPPLRAQHFIGLCRCMRGLRRLTLLVAHGECCRLSAKALAALSYLPHVELVQLHLGGTWCGGGGGGCGGPNSGGKGKGKGGGKGGGGGGGGGPKSARRERGREASVAGANSGAACGASCGEDGARTAAGGVQVQAPRLGAAAAAVLEAARALALRAGAVPRRGGDDDDAGDTSSSGDGSSGDGGSSSDGERDGGGTGDCIGDGSQANTTDGAPVAAIGVTAAAAAAMDEAARGAGPVWRLPRPLQPVRLQVDFLAPDEVAAVRAALHSECPAAGVVVEGRLQPPWLWAEAAGLVGGGGRGGHANAQPPSRRGP